MGGEAAREALAGIGVLDDVFARISQAVSKGPYLLGERFTAADIVFGSVGFWARQMLPSGEAVDAWIARLQARPALARAMAKDSPAAPA